MAVTKVSNSGIKTGVLKYDSILAGNTSIPSTPTIGTATAGNAQATVTFTAGGIPGTTYRALSSPGSLTGTSATSPITVTGLTNGTAYTFQVRAENAVGNSAYSASSNSVTPVQPTSYESIASATGNGTSGTVTFSSIPSTFQHLQIRFNWIASVAGFDLRLQMNGDTATNYVSHRMGGNHSVNAATAQVSQTFVRLGPYNGTVLTYPNFGVVDIQDYTKTTLWKTVRFYGGCDQNANGGTVNSGGGLWLSTSAITSLTVFAGSGNFNTGTVISLYGIKGS